MFKRGSIEIELMNSMEKQLVSAQIEDQYKFDRLAKAIDYLNAAANIFEENGLHKTAEEVTEIIGDMASEESDTSPEKVIDIIKQLANSDITPEDVKNILLLNPVGVQIAVIKKLYDVAKGTKEEGFFKTLKKEFEKVDLRDPEVLESFKDEMSGKLSTGLKALKFITLGLA